MASLCSLRAQCSHSCAGANLCRAGPVQNRSRHVAMAALLGMSLGESCFLYLPQPLSVSAIVAGIFPEAC
jgi:hypothetical protein